MGSGEILMGPFDGNLAGEGEIRIGPFGDSSGGNLFSYRSLHGIKKIIIVHDLNAIYSMIFKEDTFVGSPYEYSERFGVGPTQRTRTSTVEIDFPSDYLMTLSGTYGYHEGVVVIQSIRFHTKMNEYGPFGSENGTGFSFKQRGGIISGFYGHFNRFGFICSIGFYVKPLCMVFVSATLEKNLKASSYPLLNNGYEGSRLVRDPGPWGNSVGRPFDDGAYSGIKCILVHLCPKSNGLRAIQVEYLKKDESSVWVGRRGTASLSADSPPIQIALESNEFVVGIEGFFGPVEGITGGQSIIRSLTFMTDKRNYGPFGIEIGTFFNSYPGPGKILGFFGKSSAYLNSIGVHMEYF